MMVEKVEIVLMNEVGVTVFQAPTEKWIDLDGSNTIFLRVTYAAESARPITDINFYRIKCVKGSTDRMVSPN